MRWTKLKQTTEERFAPSVRGRVQVHVTRYRKAHDLEGRWDVTIDGVQIGGIGCILADREESELTDRNRETMGPVWAAQAAAMAELAATGHHTVPMFYESLSSFANLSVEDALASQDALVRALAYLDARLGKRRLRQLAPTRPPTQIEQRCLTFRLAAEGINLDGAA